MTTRVAVVSDEKQTALGAGRFVDEEMIYRDAAGEEVARMTFRILKFKPPARERRGAGRAAAPAAATPRRRPRPAQSHDNAFFWEGVAAGELRIQRCTGCKALRHPPGPMCPHCHSLDWDTLAASGRGHVYSFVVAHHPPVPPFAYPNAIALIELDEGTRLVSNLVGIDPAGRRDRPARARRVHRASTTSSCSRCSGPIPPDRRDRGRCPWTSPPPKSSLRSATSRARSSPTASRHERLLALERSGEWFDTELWSELARAGLTALAIPEAHGGGGLGMQELCAVFEEQGRHTAPVPLLATAVLGALPIAEFGTPEQRERWLRPVAEREAVLSAALLEYASSEPGAPRTSALHRGGSLAARRREALRARRGPRARDPGARAHARGRGRVPGRSERGRGHARAADRDAPRAAVARRSSSGAPAEGVLGAPGRARRSSRGSPSAPRSRSRRSRSVSPRRRTRRTARYIAERKQFGKAIATFQGVALRAADAWIDVEALRGVVMQAAWRVAAGRPASAAIATAKWWAAVAGTRVVHTAQHLHGGIGSDVEYPIHRYFLWSKQNELLVRRRAPAGGAARRARS